MLSIRSQLARPLISRSPVAAMAAVPALRASAVAMAARRFVSTERLTNNEAYDVLVNRRKERPLSPDLQIYQPQLTWYLSGLHRITGVAVGGVLYAFLIAYGLAPLAGLDFSVSGLASLFGSLPVAAKIPLKFILSYPFTFHCWNGVRHLIWDTGRALTIPQVYATGYAVLGLSLVSSLALAFM